MTTQVLQSQKYQAQIKGTNPACILFVVDQSGSMNQAAMGTQLPKKVALASVLNRFVHELTVRCTQGEDGEVRPYFHVGVIGYKDKSVQSILAGPLAGRQLVTISELADCAKTQTIREGGRTVTRKVWFEPVANGDTPMCAALGFGREIVADFISRHPDCYPPIVMHITDGGSTDGDPSGEASQLRALASNDGKVLLFNLHVSSIPATGIIFPANEQVLPDSFAQLLFGMSSTLPERILQEAVKQGYPATPGARAFAFNTDMTQLANILDVGSTAAFQQMTR